MSRQIKTPLENLIDDIYEPDDADPAVLEAALRESGVDVDAERVRYDAAVDVAVGKLRFRHDGNVRFNRYDDVRFNLNFNRH